jgi:hypothetical protein
VPVAGSMRRNRRRSNTLSRSSSRWSTGHRAEPAWTASVRRR